MIIAPLKLATDWRRFFSAIAIGLMVSVATLADEHHESADEGHRHGFHKNAIGGFVGFTGEDSRSGGGRERALTFGLEYERRFSEAFGVIVEAERAFGDLDFTVVTVPLVYHRGPWAFSAGPGIEIAEDGHEEFVFRVASLYAFDRGGYELAPKIGLDFVASEVVFFGGIVIAFGF
jgi:hypothetical protein